MGDAKDDINVLQGAIDYLTEWKNKEQSVKLTPLANNIVGRMVDISMSKAGLSLPTGQVKNVTVFMLVDAIGPDVTKVKVGDIILYMSMGHVYLRDGTHYGVVNENNLIAVVADLDPNSITIEGEKKRENGPPSPRIVT